MCRLVRDRAGTDRVCTHNDNNPRWLTLSHTQGTIRSVEGLRGERERGRAEPSASPRGGSEDFKWYQSVPIARSIGGGACVQEEAQIWNFLRQKQPQRFDRIRRLGAQNQVRFIAT